MSAELDDPAREYEAEENRIAAEIARGVCRAFLDRGSGVLTEFTLANGRRADVIALDRDGKLTIVEIKSCRADFQSDRKWQDYLDYCDSFYFAVAEDFPTELLPAETGLIIADRWNAHFLRHGAALSSPPDPAGLSSPKRTDPRKRAANPLRLAVPMDCHFCSTNGPGRRPDSGPSRSDGFRLKLL